MFNGLNNKLANVPTITGLSNVDADVVTSSSVDTDTLTLNGVDVGAQIAQIPINTAAIADLQQVTTGQSYVSVGDTTTFDNNVTLTTGKTMTADNFVGLATNASQVTVVTNNSSTTYYPTFAGGTGSGQKQLQFDTSTTPLSYIPDTSTLSATNFTAGTNVTTPNILSLASITPSDSRSILFNGTRISNGGNANCIYIGPNAGPTSGTPGNNSVALGTNALSIATGVQNFAIGPASLNLCTSGNRNTAIGAGAARNLETGFRNMCIGGASYGFPDLLISSSKCTTLGYDAYLSVDGTSYTTIIGAEVSCGTSNTVQIGRAADTTVFDGTVTNTIAQPAASDSSTKMPTTAWVQSAISAAPGPTNVVTTNTVQNITANKTMFDADLLIDDGTGNNTSLSQVNQIIKITNNNTNGTVTITGVVPSVALNRVVPTDGSNPTTAQILNKTITGTNIPNQTSPYFVSAHAFNVSIQISTLGVPAGQIGCIGITLTAGMFITSNLGTNFAAGTYVTGTAPGIDLYYINQNALNTTLNKVAHNFSTITASLTLPAAVASGTIRFGEFAEFQFLTNNTGTTTMPLNVNASRMNVNVPTTITGNATVTGTTNLAATFLNGTNVHTGVSWFNNNFLISPDTTGTQTTMRLTTAFSQTFIQAGTTNTSGSFADIVFSSMYGATNWATMNRAGLTMNGTCMYGRDDQFAFLTTPAGGLNQPIGFTTTYSETAVTFTNNTQFVYSNLPFLDNGVWTVSVFLNLTRGTGSFNNNSTMRLSVVNSGTTNYYPDSCTSQMPLPSGHTDTNYTICMTYTYIVKSTVQERTAPAGFINMATLGTATKRLKAVMTKIA